MAKIVVMGAGIGGISQVYELRKELGKEHEIFLVGDSDRFEFTPSNPWVAVGWRKGEQLKVDLPELMSKYGIGFSGAGVRRLHPDDWEARNGHKGVVLWCTDYSGAGKTTVFYMITGLIAADEGTITLDGADITDLPMYQRAKMGIG